MTKEIKKLGYQAPKGRRSNTGFMTIEVDGMYNNDKYINYCQSHKIWYDHYEQKKLLHYGKPSIDTDVSFKDGSNYYKSGQLTIGRRTRGKGSKPLSLKACIRRIRKTYNLPVGTIVNFVNNYYGIPKKLRKGKKNSFSLAYLYKVKKEKSCPVKFEVSKPSFFMNFENDEKSKELVDLLRANGFLVSVKWDVHDDYVLDDKGDAVTSIDEKGHTIWHKTNSHDFQYATAYGKGIIVGFSEKDYYYNGYTYGLKSILFDKWNWFNKWSQCEEIPKTDTNQEIVDYLIKRAKEMEIEDEEYLKNNL